MIPSDVLRLRTFINMILLWGCGLLSQGRDGSSAILECIRTCRLRCCAFVLLRSVTAFSAHEAWSMAAPEYWGPSLDESRRC